MKVSESTMSRGRRLVLAILSSIVGRAVTSFAPLIVMAPMLGHLGPSLFGIWLTATALSAMASFLDFGIGTATLTRLSDAFGKNDIASVRMLLGQSYALLGALSSVLIILVLIFFGVYSARSLSAEATDAASVFAIALISIFLSFPSQIIIKVLEARQAFVHSQLAQIAGPMCALSACLWGISAGLNPVAVVVLYVLPNAGILALWSVTYFILFPNHRPTFNGLKLNQIKHLISLGGAFFIVLIFYVISMNADNVIIAAKGGSALVAEYGVPAKLGSIMIVMVGTVFMPLWPIYGHALAQKDHAWLRVATRRISLVGAASVLMLGMVLTALSGPIMTVWMGRNFDDQHLIMLGWTAAATVIALTAPYNSVLNAAGRALPQLLPWAIFAGISIGLKVVTLNGEMVWLAPWITAGVYALTITPSVMRFAQREMALEGTIR